jgi:hypothetical protein
MKHYLALLLLVIAAVSCGKVKEKARESINKGGETVGKTVTEFFEGISEGIDKTLQCEILLSPELQSKGIKTGKFSINHLQEGGNNSLLTLYLIFEKDFKSSIMVKVSDKTGLETGRAKLDIENQAGNAGYYNFAFNTQTCMEVKSKIYLYVQATCQRVMSEFSISSSNPTQSLAANKRNIAKVLQKSLIVNLKSIKI